MDVLLATNNQGKVERYMKLIAHAGLDVTLHTPDARGIEVVDVEENGSTLADNAELKARAYEGKVDVPVLANDSGFYVSGEGFIDAPKREALQGVNEQDLSHEEIAQKMTDFWKGIAEKHGGEVDAAWIDAFVLMLPSGGIKTAESKREVLLTNKELGGVHIQFPVRALYYSKDTGKPAAQHTEEEELFEMQPVIDALRIVLG